MEWGELTASATKLLFQRHVPHVYLRLIRIFWIIEDKIAEEEEEVTNRMLGTIESFAFVDSKNAVKLNQLTLLGSLHLVY